MRSRVSGRSRYVDDGQLEIKNNAAEARCASTRSAANFLFAGSDSVRRTRRRHILAARLSQAQRPDPEICLHHVLERTADPISRIHDMLPWNLVVPHNTNPHRVCIHMMLLGYKL